MIRFEHVGKRYPNGRTALADVGFEIGPGEMVFLTGRSGAGKSTILHLAALLERPSQGTVTVNGRDTSRLSARQVPAFRRQLGMVFQNHLLLPDRSVYDNIALPLVVAHASTRDIDKRVRTALELVGLADQAGALPTELSVGEQQRVGIARAVVGRPPLLVADEPTGNLDPQLSRDVMKVFRRFSEAGVTVLVATHDLALVRESGQRVIHIAEGRVTVPDAAAAGDIA
ncbi:MAG: cell division ATP-binding protein FtsE [Pseudomonadota bacterium]|jgi:cell division transport system ATP-binding protein